MKSIAIDKLKPNDWNPNAMTDEEFDELVSEIKHLGKPPKPIILRKNGKDLEIVDGEHCWRALQEAGISELQPGWYELETYDDFEAMRQTYKRNQHGTHGPLKQGYLFERMMAERDLSIRALADEIELSEGTIRNSLEYAKASRVRNDYAFDKLGVKQIRAYNRLPGVLANFWIDTTDGDLKALYLNKHQRAYFGYHDSDWTIEHIDEDEFPEHVSGIFGPLLDLLPELRTRDFDKAIKRLAEIKDGLRLGSYRVRLGEEKFAYTGWSVKAEDALPYIKAWLTLGWQPRHQGRFIGNTTIYTHWMRDVFQSICRVVDREIKIVVPIADFEQLLTTAKFESIYDLKSTLELLLEATNPELKEQDPKEAIWELEVKAKAPAFIRDAKITIEQKHRLWRGGQGYASGFAGPMIEVAQQAVIKQLEEANAAVEEWGDDITQIASNVSGYEFRNPERLLGKLLKAMLAEHQRSSVEDLKPFIESVAKAAIGEGWERLAVRLASIDEAELRLLGAHVLGRHQMGEIGFELHTPHAKERWLQEFQTD